MENDKSDVTMKRPRSPNYPGYNLEACIENVRKIYKRFGSGEVSEEDAIRAMGLSIKSSSANRLLAAMISFELLQQKLIKNVKFLKITRTAQEILLNEIGSPDWQNSVQQALKSNRPIMDVISSWESVVPPKETIIRKLILEKDYSHEGAKRFANIIIDSIEYSGLFSTKSSEPQLNSNDTIENLFIDSNSSNDVEKVNQNAISSDRSANLLLPGKTGKFRLLSQMT